MTPYFKLRPKKDCILLKKLKLYIVLRDIYIDCTKKKILFIIKIIRGHAFCKGISREYLE